MNVKTSRKVFLKRIVFGFFSLLIVVGVGRPAVNDVHAADFAPKASEETTAPVLKAGEKINLDVDHYFVYSFDKKPQMGTVIMKIQVFDSTGKQDSPYDITGDLGMPSMRGAHDTGARPFKLNKKGDYLLPVDVVMPGGWELLLQFYRENKPIFVGKVEFSV